MVVAEEEAERVASRALGVIAATCTVPSLTSADRAPWLFSARPDHHYAGLIAKDNEDSTLR